MYQMFLVFLKVAATGVLVIFALVFLFLVIKKWKNRRSKIINLCFLFIFVSAAAYIGSINLFSNESKDRDKTAEAFEDNFGFAPPASVENIYLKNLFIYDASAHWLGFTYDSAVLAKIIAHDQLLTLIESNTSEFVDAAYDVYEGANNPKWLTPPIECAERIFYKKDFLDHSRSEYYLWVDSVNQMVFLHVSYSD